MSIPPNNPELETFLSAFASCGSRNYYYAYNKQDYRFQDAPVTDAVIAGHLNNTQPIAIVPFSGSETCLAAFDIDNHGGKASWSEVVKLTKPLVNALREDDLNPFVVRSGGGDGIHIWLIFKEPQNAANVRRVQKKVLAKIGLRSGTAGIVDGTVEIYPKQDEILDGQKGNCIALPFARQSVPLDNDLNPVSFDEYKIPDIEDLYSPPIPPDEGEDASAGKPKRPTPMPDNVSVLPGDLEEVASALKYLPADDYDQWIKAGLALKHTFGEDGFPVWNDWSATAAEKYSGEVACREKWNAFEPTGDLGLGTIFYLAQQQSWNGPSDPEVRDMNTRFGILTQGKRTQIIDKLAQTENDQPLVVMSKEPFKDRLLPKEIAVSGGKKIIPLAEYWLSHRKAARYDEVIFNPSLLPGHNGTKWNIWKGFACKAKPGDWSKLQQHILDNICSGDKELCNWMLNWMALGVQKPSAPIGTAPVLQGSPGTGKSFLARMYGKLWGSHTVEVTHQSHVSGQFNAHLFGKRFIFIDEGIFGGDKANAGLIKTRVTESFILFEQKGVDAVRMPNRMIFMVASNEESVIAADKGERRWMVIEVSDSKREDRAFFAAIEKQMEEGGFEAMLHDLLNRDITKGPNPRRIIKTEALFAQVLNGLDPMERYMHQILDEGRLPQSSVNGHRTATIKAMWKELQETQPNGKYVTPAKLGRFISKYFDKVVVKAQNGIYQARNSANSPEEERSTLYTFYALPQCRKRFEKMIGQSVPWSNDLEDWLND